jgi:S1-C subfamily serine protease
VQSRTNGAPPGALGFEYQAQAVTAVDPRGPASALRKGDVITSVDGVALATVPGCLSQLLEVPAGTTLAIGVQRGATVKVTAGQPR